MGLASEKFARQIGQLVSAHLENPETAIVESRSSSKGKYLSVSVTFTASDQSHLEAVYTDLNACDDVVFTL